MPNSAFWNKVNKYRANNLMDAKIFMFDKTFKSRMMYIDSFVKRHVLFVCTGNTCRSPMAKYLFDKVLKDAGLAKNFVADSAGIFSQPGQKASNFAIEVMKEIGIDIDCHTSKQVTQKLVNSADAIFCMTEGHRKALLKDFKKISEKCFLIKEFSECKDMDIHDPFFGDINDYRIARDEIKSSMGAILKFLKSDEN